MTVISAGLLILSWQKGT